MGEVKFRCVGDNVLVLLDERRESGTASGLIVPARKADEIEGVMGTVIVSGPGTDYVTRAKPGRRSTPSDASPRIGTGFVPNETRAGDRVMLDSAGAGDRIPVDELANLGLEAGRDYRIVREAEIAAILDG